MDCHLLGRLGGLGRKLQREQGESVVTGEPLLSSARAFCPKGPSGSALWAGVFHAVLLEMRLQLSWKALVKQDEPLGPIPVAPPKRTKLVELMEKTPFNSVYPGAKRMPGSLT